MLVRDARAGGAVVQGECVSHKATGRTFGVSSPVTVGLVGLVPDIGRGTLPPRVAGTRKLIPGAEIIDSAVSGDRHGGRRPDRGRDAHHWAPPAQNRTCGFPAYGSHLGCLTAKRALGHG